MPTWKFAFAIYKNSLNSVTDVKPVDNRRVTMSLKYEKQKLYI